MEEPNQERVGPKRTSPMKAQATPSTPSSSKPVHRRTISRNGKRRSSSAFTQVSQSPVVINGYSLQSSPICSIRRKRRGVSYSFTPIVHTPRTSSFENDQSWPNKSCCTLNGSMTKASMHRFCKRFAKGVNFKTTTLQSTPVKAKPPQRTFTNELLLKPSMQVFRPIPVRVLFVGSTMETGQPVFTHYDKEL
mmetsp:Transcript_24992/g.41920  ORF Transcript_24992/g.41920 Transcript_24992/m.41920 type:complete len:192 (-) Transcript_24992:309-884(-)